VGAVARALHAATGPVFVGLLPHGLFEIFALTLAFALPTRVVVRRLMGVPWTRSAQEVAPLLVRASAIALVSLALAAVVESTVSPQVLRWLVPGYRVATASISTLAPRGKAATPTVTRAGRASPKARA
jgi:uncharacterized membrane protein SpoIIM required for sporulation